MVVNTEPVVCVAKPSEFLAVRALVVDGLAKRWQRYDPSCNPDLESFESFYSSSHSVVAKVEGQIIGCGTLVHEAESVARIVRMSILASLQRKGIGGAILNRLLEHAATIGYKEVVLETTTTWVSAVAFYEHHGFVKTMVKGFDQHFRLPLTDSGS